MKSNLCPICDTDNIELVEQQRTKSQRRVAANIAQHLCFVLQIKNGRELVLLFGEGDERNNELALENLIFGKIQSLPEWPVSKDELKSYVRELEVEIKEKLFVFCESWS